MLTFSSMSQLRAKPATKPRLAVELPRGGAAESPLAGEWSGLADGERTEALRAFQDAQLEKKEIERRLQLLQAEIGVTLSEISQRAPVAYFDGWAPRDLPLLPSPIHRVLLMPQELREEPGAAEAMQPAAEPELAAGPELAAPANNIADPRSLPPPGTLPCLGYLPWPKRILAQTFGRLGLLIGGFLSLPQRAINQALAEKLEALETRMGMAERTERVARLESRVAQLERQTAQLAADRERLRAGVLLLAERSAANFAFLDQCDRERLVELHQKADQLRSEWRGDLERTAARLDGELAEKLELKAPGHRLALLEIEYSTAEMKSQLAWHRLLMAELKQRLDRPAGPA